MKNLFLVIAFAFTTTAFAGPNVSVGPQATENVVSKLKIEAVMAAVTGPNEAILAVYQDAGGLDYVAVVKDTTGNACSATLYSVTPIQGSSPVKYEAKYRELLQAGACN